jgi:hypothetical protein
MFKQYYIGNYKDFLSDITPVVQCISIQGRDLIGLELGVYKADSFMTLLENCPNIKTLYGVDNYKPYYDVFEDREISILESDMIRSESLLKQKHSQYADKIKFFECASVEAATKIDDESLDFIFIDADHSYESVMQDLTIWYPKLKPGGLLTGHDYHMRTVEEAVKHFRSLNNIDSLMGVYLSSYAWKK